VAKPQRRNAPPAPKGQSYMILMMVLMLFVMADPSLSSALGSGMALLLNPTIGFSGHMPVISILLAGMITGVISTGLRHWSSDYVALERGRVLQRTFQKELTDARLKRDVDRVERMRRAQPFLMSLTMEAQYATMKPAVGTMLIALAVYGWMRVFLATQVHTSSVSLPWTAQWALPPGSLQMMLLYAVMSLPITVVIGASLKLWRFRHFDPKAPLAPLPTVDDLVRRAEGEIDDETTVKKESERARRRLKAAGEDGGEGGDEVEIEEDDGSDAEIVDADEDEVDIVDAEPAEEHPAAPAAKPRSAWPFARLAEPAGKSDKDGGEE
jgi:uncharacterized membrane protein (DUF106 family)